MKNLSPITEDNDIEIKNHTHTAIYTTTIATTDWITNSGGGFYCTKAVSGVLSTDNLIVDVVLSADITAAGLQLNAYKCVCNGNITVANNSITVYCFDTKPTTALTLGLQVIR